MVAHNNFQTALHLAVYAGCEEAVRLLISAGSDVNMATNFEKSTPLHLACEGSWRGICKLLLDNGKISI
jgi:ankyrin repeat protein